MTEDYFTRGEKEFLLKIARTTLEKFVTEGERCEPQTVNSKLWEKMGVFVTLTKNGDLRGCIGYTEPIEPLMLAVRDNTISAAKDSRFDPIERGELGDINIEISILSELERTAFDDIGTGDGVVIKSGLNGATYLPQVWADFAKAMSPKEEFIKSLCLKAGLEENAYLEEGIEFYKYSVIKFSEQTIG
ncbi:MAG: AmmeMemoRadiSam system protein A [Patescibacteria group bacterium]|jgi:hypothetical protein